MALYPGATYPDGSLYPSDTSYPTSVPPLTATPEPDHAPPRVRLDITDVAVSYVVITRQDADGHVRQVRTYDGAPLPVSGGLATIYDYECPYGQQVTYSTDVSDPTTNDIVTVTAPAVLDVPDVWLVHPNVPIRSMPIRIARMSDRQASANQSVRYPLGRKYPIRAHDGQRKAEAYTLTLRTGSADELAKLKLLLDDLATLLLNVPVSKRWVEPGTEYIGPGDLTRANPANFARSGYREWSLPVVVADWPSGGTQAFNTYGYSRSLYATYGDRRAAHATYRDAFDLV